MVKKFEVNITPFGLKRTVQIYLPKGYDKDDEAYPVIYMFDGHNLFSDKDATYGKCWGLKEFMDSYKRKMIIVGVECNPVGDGRIYEYFPYQRIPGRYIHTYVDGKGDIYMQWLVKELKPYIDANYRTLPDRMHTAIAGSSMGGLMSLFAITKYNSYFGYAACLSSSVLMAPEEILLEALEAEISPDTRIWMDYGTKEVKNKRITARCFAHHRRILRALLKKTEHATFYIDEGATHCEACWEKRIPTYMEYLFDSE